MIQAFLLLPHVFQFFKGAFQRGRGGFFQFRLEFVKSNFDIRVVKMKRVRHAEKLAKPLYKTHANFDLSEDSEDEAKTAMAKFSLVAQGAAFAPQKQTQMFADILKKYKKPEEPIAKYLDDFCKYKLYLAYFAEDGTKEPPVISMETDGEALINDKKSIAAAHIGYNEFKKLLPKHKEDTLSAINTSSSTAGIQSFIAELKACKEMHLVKRKRELVLGNGKHMTCATDEIANLFVALHVTLHFESYLAHLLDDLWNEKEEEMAGMTFCFIYEIFSVNFQPFRLIFQR